MKICIIKPIFGFDELGSQEPPQKEILYRGFLGVKEKARTGQENIEQEAGKTLTGSR